VNPEVSTPLVEVERRQFVNKKGDGKDSHFVDIDQKEDLYLKKIREKGENQVDYSVKKPVDPNEPRDQQKK